MSKRIKSFLITASSIFTTAFIAVTFTPEWASFLTYANDKLLGFGIPAVVIAVIGVLVSEIWKGVLNKITISKAIRDGIASSSYRYTDVRNELY